MAKLSGSVAKALETLMEGHNYDTRTVVHLIARATKYGNSDEVELLRCANFNDILSALVELELARSASETTASPSETAADKGILTEEELKELERLFWVDSDFGNRFFPSLEYLFVSHRNLLSANAELSFKNQKYRSFLTDLDTLFGMPGEEFESRLYELLKEMSK